MGLNSWRCFAACARVRWDVWVLIKVDIRVWTWICQCLGREACRLRCGGRGVIGYIIVLATPIIEYMTSSRCKVNLRRFAWAMSITSIFWYQAIDGIHVIYVCVSVCYLRISSDTSWAVILEAAPVFTEVTASGCVCVWLCVDSRVKPIFKVVVSSVCVWFYNPDAYLFCSMCIVVIQKIPYLQTFHYSS